MSAKLLNISWYGAKVGETSLSVPPRYKNSVDTSYTDTLVRTAATWQSGVWTSADYNDDSVDTCTRNIGTVYTGRIEVYMWCQKLFLTLESRGLWFLVRVEVRGIYNHTTYMSTVISHDKG